MGRAAVSLEVRWPSGRAVLVTVKEITELLGVDAADRDDEGQVAPRVTFTDTDDKAAFDAFLRRVTRFATDPVDAEAYPPEMERLLELLKVSADTPMPIKRDIRGDD